MQARSASRTASRSVIPLSRGKKRRASRAVGSRPETLEPRWLMAAVIWMENFDELNYGKWQEEGEQQYRADHVWTKVPPTGWVKDDTHVPGYNNPDLPAPEPDPNDPTAGGPTNEDDNGVTEWIGWTFADHNWWANV